MAIQFTEENFNKNTGFEEMKTSSQLAKWLIQSGLAKDVASASLIMTIAALCIFGLSIYFFIFGFSLPTFGEPTPTRIQIPVSPTQNN